MRVEKYGPASERLSDQQLELLEQEPGVSEAEVQAESERAQLQLPLKRSKQKPARQSLPVELPRIEQLIVCEAQECVCGGCGREKVVIGYESAEQLDIEPAKYFVRVTKREKRACPHCPEQGVACALLPPRIIEKSLASDRLIIETIVNKYADYVPLYRQSAILERDSRVELSRATLCGWVMRVGELLRPLSRAMAEELLGATICRPMKRRWECKCTMVAARTTKPTCGNIADQQEWCSSTSNSRAAGKDPNGF